MPYYFVVLYFLLGSVFVCFGKNRIEKKWKWSIKYAELEKEKFKQIRSGIKVENLREEWWLDTINEELTDNKKDFDSLYVLWEFAFPILCETLYNYAFGASYQGDQIYFPKDTVSGNSFACDF